MTPAVTWFVAVQFIALLAASCLVLWQADRMPVAEAAVWLAALVVGLWAVGAVMQGRIGMPEVLLLQAAALSMATAQQGWIQLHHVAKPLAMVLAIAVVVARAGWLRSARSFDYLLVAALLFCLAGDVLLMLPGLFIAGLASFLCAHLCYLALFRQGQPWFPSRPALAATLAAAVLMVAFLFPHLGPVLRVAVPAYALVIALMAAQAIGRATVLRDANAVGVAVGAGLFMVSDTLLAINRFAQPLPMAAFLVLATYYAAQVLIVHHARAPAAALLRTSASPSSPPAGPAGAATRAASRV
jgi:uncharacterized membrane protein YhhN